MHVLFSVIAFGTWENKRTVISRKREDEGLKYELINDVVSKNSSLKALIEITTGLSNLNSMNMIKCSVALNGATYSI